MRNGVLPVSLALAVVLAGCTGTITGPADVATVAGVTATVTTTRPAARPKPTLAVAPTPTPAASPVPATPTPTPAPLAAAQPTPHPAGPVLNVDRLSDADIQAVQAIIERLQPLIGQRRARSDLAKLTFDELYAPLDEPQRKLLDAVRALDGKALGVKLPYVGIATGNEEFVVLRGQRVGPPGRQYTIPPQFVVKEAHRRFEEMMAAMDKDLGKRMYVESGYRSSAYQLYLFVFYLKNHRYSIRETARFVALPGYSEHGDPKHQAVDLINAEGVNQDQREAFAKLPEYRWLTENAGRFGFVLSYPPGNPAGITFEPWHWRYDPDAAEAK